MTVSAQSEPWSPERATHPPVFMWPPRPLAALRWFAGWPGYLFPYNAFYAVVALAMWSWATPAMSTMIDFRPGWIALVLVRNFAIVIAWFGLLHWRLYRARAQDTTFKFNPRWPGGSDRFTLGSQLRDNVLWTLVSGVPIWTAWEVLTLWLFANGHIPSMTWADNPLWFVAWMLLIPVFRDIHFYAVHRLIHWPPLYKAVHSLHHRNTNPGPWSGLAMHPLEHLVYFSCLAIHWVVPSHPLHIMFNSMHVVLAPAPGHAGFERIMVAGGSLATGGYAHYLHHKLFEVNYADGVIPLDRWFGSFHDGSPEADEAFKRRRKAFVE